MIAEHFRDHVHGKLVVAGGYRRMGRENALASNGLNVFICDLVTLRSAADRIVSPARTPRPPLYVGIRGSMPVFMEKWAMDCSSTIIRHSKPEAGHPSRTPVAHTADQAGVQTEKQSTMQSLGKDGDRSTGHACQEQDCLMATLEAEVAEQFLGPGGEAPRLDLHPADIVSRQPCSQLAG